MSVRKFDQSVHITTSKAISCIQIGRRVSYTHHVVPNMNITIRNKYYNLLNYDFARRLKYLRIDSFLFLQKVNTVAKAAFTHSKLQIHCFLSKTKNGHREK